MSSENDQKVAKNLTLGTFIGMTMALCATVRSIPSVAATGWAQITYMLFAVIFFALPVALIAGELGTMMQADGGPQLWVKTALGERWGFVTSWLLWVQMFPGMVMVASTIGPLIGNTVGDATLGNNHWFTLACILVCYWIITFLNLKFDMAKFGGQLGVWLGVYIPIVILMVMGALATIKVGINPHGYLGDFSFAKLIPHDVQSLQYFAAIAFVFVGIEISSVYIPRLHNAEKNYSNGVLIALIGLILMNIVNSIFVSNIVPNGQIELTNITQPILLYCKVLHWPLWIGNVFSFLVVIGVLIQLSAWVTGPGQTMIQVARDGQLPPKWHYYRMNEYGASRNIILTQSICISLFALLYGVMKNVNGVFLTLTNTTTILYAIVYVLIAIALIKLRKQQPNTPRPYRIGKSGNGLAYLVSYALLFGIAVVIIGTLVATPLSQSIMIIILTVVLVVIPIIIDKKKKDSWKTDVDRDLQEYNK